ncbi:MAG TPA: GerMN domain-containing protein [Candidatus Paceibacterota bacterium]|nr:GerMN domain-containing protein [Candidatus Paceibacterota bacterium]
MNKTTLAIAIVLLLVLCVGGYLFFASNPETATPEPMLEEQIETEEAPGERTVSLFYYDPSRDMNAEGNIMCTEKGLVAVSRTIATKTPIEETIRLLLSGDLTQAERAQGITTEYPLPGVSLASVALSADGKLTIALSDPENRTGGGSCRAAVLWSQVRATALQFPEVKEVSFTPEDLFQP